MIKIQKQICECCGGSSFKNIGWNRIQCEYCDSIYDVVATDSADTKTASTYTISTEQRISPKEYVAVCDVYIRSGCGIDCSVLDSVEKNTVLTATAIYGEWLRVSFNGTEGYVLKKNFVEKDVLDFDNKKKEIEWAKTCDDAVKLKNECNQKIRVANLINLTLILFSAIIYNWSNNSLFTILMVVFAVRLVVRPKKIKKITKYAWALSICEVNGL